MPNAAWATVLVVLLGVLTLVAWYRIRSVAPVVICHNAVWAGAILLVGLNLIDYDVASTEAWLVLTGGLVAFNLGALCSKWIGRFFRTPHLVSLKAPKRGALVTRRTLWLLFVVYAVAFGLYLLNIGQRFGLSTLISDPTSIRAFRNPSYLESVPLPVRLLLYLGPLLFVIFGYKEAVDRPFPLLLRLGTMILLAGSMLALLQRTNLFMGVLLLAALLVTKSRRAQSAIPEHGLIAKARSSGFGRKLWQLHGQVRGHGRVVMAVVSLGFVALFAFQLVGGALHKNGQQALSTGTVSSPLAASGLTEPYIYYTGGTMAFLQLVDSPNRSWPPLRGEDRILIGDFNPQTYGASTFAPVLKLIPGARPWNDINPFIDTGVLTNVYTWLEPFYRDFRFPGVAIATFLLGMVMSVLYHKRFESTRLFWLQGAMISTLFLATFITKINDTLFIAELIFILLLTSTTPASLSRFIFRGRNGRKRKARIVGGATLRDSNRVAAITGSDS